MKNKLLFFDMEFTSLSPDAQLISLGIVSDCDKSFYAEFSDFDIERCDDWVKENVVSKLITERINLLRKREGNDYLITDADVSAITNRENAVLMDFNNGKHHAVVCQDENTKHGDLRVIRDNPICWGEKGSISVVLDYWLRQFSDYQIQFVVDCGTYDFYWMVQLLAEWDINDKITSNVNYFSDKFGFDNGGRLVEKRNGEDILISSCIHRIGLPKLPANISPVPFDLNDLIAIKRGITPIEAFDLDREKLAYGEPQIFVNDNVRFDGEEVLKHNALFDSKVIKEIYNKLK